MLESHISQDYLYSMELKLSNNEIELLIFGWKLQGNIIRYRDDGNYFTEKVYLLSNSEYRGLPNLEFEKNSYIMTFSQEILVNLLKFIKNLKTLEIDEFETAYHPPGHIHSCRNPLYLKVV